MYSTFKDLKAGSEKDKYSDKENKSKQEIDFQNFLKKSKAETSKDQLGQQKLLNSSFGTNINTNSIKAVHDKPITRSRKLISTNKCGYQSDSCSSSSLTNPLLDTISSLTLNDPYSDSDDYDVSKKVYYQKHRRKCGRMLRNRAIRCSPSHPFSSSDAESIVYAGSNSIDSGYKSLCPTPEVPDSNSKFKILEVVEKGLTECRKINFAKQKSVKSLINPCEANEFMSNNESFAESLSRFDDSNSSLYNAKMCMRQKINEKKAHLEHLKSVRQSLINAIQKCIQADSIVSPTRVSSPVLFSRSSSPASTVILKKIKPNTDDLDSTSSSTSNTILTSEGTLNNKENLQHSNAQTLSSNCKLVNTVALYSSPISETNINLSSPTGSFTDFSNSKSVRFNNDVTITPFTPTNSSSFNDNYNQIYNQDEDLFISDTLHPNSESLTTKPILKDSLCASLLSQIESGQFCSDYSLEGEIDNLLYGPRKTATTCCDFNVDHLVDIPYVAMIENKYRKNQNTLNNTKLKGKYQQNGDKR